MSTRGPQVPAPLQWAEGMMLTPQHLQQSDIYWHALLSHRLAGAQPFHWGVRALALDRGRLARGDLRIERLQAILPDGLVIEHPEDAPDRALQMDLTSLQGLRPGISVRIHVGAPIRAEGAASPAAPIQRFESIRPTLATDENTGDGETEIHRMRARLRLLRGDALPGGYVTMPLLEVLCRGRGQFELTPYQPPALRIDATDFLGADAIQPALDRLARLLRHKAEELAGSGPDRGTGPAVASAESQRVIAALAAGLPRLEALAGTGAVHPFTAYLALCDVAGQMAALSADRVPPRAEGYAHEDAGPAFLHLLEAVTRAAESVQLAWDTITLDSAAPGRFAARLTRTQLSRRLLLELRGREGQPLRALRDWLELARIASEPLIPELERTRTTGAEVQALTGEEIRGLQLPVTGVLVELRNSVLDIDGRRVPAIGPDEPLVLHGPDGDGAPRAAVLYVQRSAPAATRDG